ncbi:sulfite exporter TauE/SafE family protein [Salipiger mangrovisoli]|uniref:Probable membrane transporter protein n=1 Tax=Salipiger mangrovisoli TaxID=2865933 RepID=A0ABR9WZ87_9RHOB|nr:sulfite exporter TauE/SafE family protein [Salipiger mangrovisoli]MBE9636625.1 sulfite exporter TauE/SafE family protein [Salipiger mangrovisoli]
MDALLTLVSPPVLALAFAVAALAGLIKGMVGFAMPMIMISGLGSLVSPELALAGLILPTVATNALQALGEGPRAAWETAKRFKVLLVVALAMLAISAQLVRVLPVQVLLAMIGGPVFVFCLLQLAGWKPNLPNGSTPRIEATVGAVAGFIGGMSGVWGPPFVAYLTAIGTEKRDQIRVQGVAYGLGAIALVAAHTVSGVFSAQTAPFSAALLVPAMAGMWLGRRVHDRIDQSMFRKLTLIVLLVAALNLLRRAFFG